MKFKLFIFSACLLFATNIHAKDYKLFGRIQFGDSKPAKEIQVIAMTTDSVIKNAQLTSQKGVFAWTNLPARPYLFYVNAIGYQRMSMLIDWKNNQNVDLGTITLSPINSDKEVELPEVVVKGSQIIQKVDKMIVFPQAKEVKMSAGSIDLLHTLNLPGMNVNPVEQRISIDGQAPIYQINGRPQSREQILGLRPENIARIEYSNTPSIRYINQNAGGIINFILKERQTGGSVYANAMASPMTGFLNGTLSSSFNYKKSEFTFLYNNNWRDYTDRWTEREESFNSSNHSVDRYSHGIKSPFGYLSQDINLGYTLQIDDNNMFSAMLMNNIGRQHTSINALMEERSDEKMVEFARQSKAVFEGYSPSLDLFFLHKFKKNQSLEFNLVGTLNNGKYERNLNDLYTDREETIINDVDNNRSSLIAEATYRKSLRTQQLSFGVKHVQSYTRNEYTGTNQDVTKMNSRDTYIYGEWSGRLKKLSYSLGTGVKIYSVDNKTENRNYIRNLTTLSLLYPIFNKLKVSYLLQVTPTLPTLSQLSDIEQTYDDILTIRGNAQLKAYTAIRNRFLFIYTHKKLRTNLWLSHTKAFQPISRYTLYENNKFVSEYQNQNYNQQTNVQLDVNLSKLFNCINLSVIGGWNRYSTSGAQYHHYLYNLYWSASAQAYYKDWSLSASYTRPQKSLSGETISLSENNSTVLLGYKYGNFYFRGGVYYPFTRAWKSRNSSLSTANPCSETVRIKDNGNMVIIGITYQLGYGKSLKKSRKSLKNVDNEVGILKVQE